MKIRSIIIDDELNNIQNLRTVLDKYCPDISVVATATNGDEGISTIRLHQPQLIFLDIQMPEKSGFDLLRELSPLNFEVIFITAYDNYGIQAIKFSALDYLLKPIDITELKLAVEKARQKIAAKSTNDNLKNLLDYMKRGQENPKIALPTLQEIRYVKVDEIIRCEASNNYTTFFLQSGEAILVCKTLKEFAELLRPHAFVRTHQSHLVNISFVKSLLKEDGGVLLMKDGIKIPISRLNRDQVKETLGTMLG